MRVGTASQPASIAAESEAAHGEMEFLHNENAKLKKENEKLKKNMEKLASYAFGRFNALAADSDEGIEAPLRSGALELQGGHRCARV